MSLGSRNESAIPEGRVSRQELQEALGAFLFNFDACNNNMESFERNKRRLFSRIETVLHYANITHARWTSFLKDPTAREQPISHTFHSTSQLYLQESGHLRRPIWKIPDQHCPSDAQLDQIQRDHQNYIRQRNTTVSTIDGIIATTRSIGLEQWDDILVPCLIKIQTLLVDLVLDCLPGRPFLNMLKN